MSIKIWEPRYRDRGCLIARYKIPAGQAIEVEIERGAYKGLYKVQPETIAHSNIESLSTRNGQTISVRVISLDEMEKIKGE